MTDRSVSAMLEWNRRTGAVLTILAFLVMAAAAPAQVTAPQPGEGQLEPPLEVLDPGKPSRIEAPDFPAEGSRIPSGADPTGDDGSTTFNPTSGLAASVRQPAGTWNDRLLVLDGKGAPVQTVSPSALKRPSLLAPAEGGDLLIALFESQQVLRLDSGWEVKGTFGGRGEREGQFLQLAALRPLPGGRIACGDLGASLVRVVDGHGRTMASLDWESTGLAADPAGRLLDLAYAEESGYSLRARTLDGAAQRLFAISGKALEGGKLLGMDGKGGWWVRFTKADRPGLLAVRHLDAGGRQLGAELELPHLVSEGTVFVQADGRLLWLDYDATTAPAGKVRLWQTD